jgi:beta-lactamase regulating signal transducer with metallopeptidase domain
MAATSAATPAGVGVPLHWFFAVWLVGAVSLPLIWWVRAARARRRLRELSRCDRDRLEALGCAAGVAGPGRRARVLVDPHANAPYVTGLLSAAIVLPNDWGVWPARALSHALEHEVMHLRRRDLWIEAVWMTVTACYWFHPLVHVARRRAHETREASCDAAVARRLGRGYRRSLLELAAGWPALESAAGPPARHGWGPMVVRIRLLDRWPSPLSLRIRVAAALVLAAGAFAILPSHVGADSPPPAGFTLQQLTDPAARQESGLGSLHLRYELMRRNNLERSSR